jgi:hypothetical protein
MSKMKDVSIEIQEYLADGLTPAEVAAKMNVPIEWVHEEETWHDGVEYDEHGKLVLPDSIGMSDASGMNY